jgi:hypothetical protein
MDANELGLRLEDLKRARRQYVDAYSRATEVVRLPLPFGPRVDAGRLAAVYILFHLSLLIAGSVLIFVGRTHDLGVGLVVGPLFAIGAFGAQTWAIFAERQRLIREETLGASYFYGDLLKLGDELRTITMQLERLEGSGQTRVPFSRLSVEEIRRRLRPESDALDPVDSTG